MSFVAVQITVMLFPVPVVSWCQKRQLTFLIQNKKRALNLSFVLQSFLIHWHATNILLLATLVPIIKDKLGSINVSKNYRSIAISSILLKLIDWVFILLYGKHFGLNDFQFALQKKS